MSFFLQSNGDVIDTARIDATMDTIRYLLDNKDIKSLALIAHLGRPGANYKKSDYSLEPCIKVLRQYLPGHKVVFLPDCVGPAVEQAINDCEPGTVFLLENLRFHIEETGKGVSTKDEPIKAKKEDVETFKQGLSRLGDVFVFEAFGAAHRSQASITGVNIPQRVAGLLMQKELNTYAKVLGNPERPFLTIIGGSKITDKILVIENMLDMVDEMIIGGAMAYTFKKVLQGVKIGDSRFDKHGATLVEGIMRKAAEKKVKIHFPIDHIIADKFDEHATVGITSDDLGVPDGWMALDVGPQSRAIFSKVIKRAKTVLWNGPLGVFEMGAFSSGTLSAMWDLVKSTREGNTCIVGGGDTGTACAKFTCGNDTIDNQITHVSTGGGSSLCLMEGKMLPAVSHLSDRTDGTSCRFPKAEEKSRK